MSKDLHTFQKGMQSDITDYAESKTSYVFGLNGRVYSNNGIFSFVSIKGEKLEIIDSNIKKYLGYTVVNDAVYCLIKVSKSIPLTEITGVEIPHLNVIADNKNEYLNDLSKLYYLNNNVPNLKPSSNIEFENINNKDFNDAFIKIYYEDNILKHKYIYVGQQNWSNQKMIIESILESQNEIKLYFTNYDIPIQYAKIINDSIDYSDQNMFKKISLLTPKNKEIKKGGSLNAMTVFYSYRLITKNGVFTEYSSFSKETIIPAIKDDVNYEGGNEDKTNYMSVVQCNLINPNNFKYIQCVAIEFQTLNNPIVKNLGTKEITNSIIYFNHFGNENEFYVSLEDVITKRSTFEYASDLKIKNNILSVFALQNKPINNISKELEYLFRLKSFNSNMNTYSNEIYNRNPLIYRFIDIDNTEPLFYETKRIYKSIFVSGNYKVVLLNSNTNQYLSRDFDNTIKYNEQANEINQWLQELIGQPNFNTLFPNLKIEYLSNKIVFEEIDISLKTDISKYKLKILTDKKIIDINYFNNQLFPNYTGTNKIWGYLSTGFNSGNGIRISFETETEKLLTKATDIYQDNDNVLNTYYPNFEKSFFKGEIYRLFIQFKKTNTEYFSIPLGDIKIPDLTELKKSISENGNPLLTNEKYVNQLVDNNDLKSEKVFLKVEFRLDDTFKNDIDTWQLMYVQRTEDNRTIHAQGVSAPLMRVLNPTDSFDKGWLNERETEHYKLHSKWLLPYMGGPVYDKKGFEMYDAHGNDYNEKHYDMNKRVIYSRNLMYIDSPDMIFEKVTSSIKNKKLALIGTLQTDHTPDIITCSGRNDNNVSREIYPKFSRKIYYNNLTTKYYPNNPVPWLKDMPYYDMLLDYWINVSVFSNSKYHDAQDEYNISYKKEMAVEQVSSGNSLNIDHNISNHSLHTPVNQAWFYDRFQRRVNENNGEYESQAIGESTSVVGGKTVFIKLEDDLFTQNFFDDNDIIYPKADNDTYGDANTRFYDIYSSLALINILNNNIDSIYGGNKKEDFLSNIVVPLSDVIPIHKESNTAQVIRVYGDTYLTLFTRVKTFKDKTDFGTFDLKIAAGSDNIITKENYNRISNGWIYSVVLETMVEPKLIDNNIFNDRKINLKTQKEFLLSGYLQENTLKNSISKPLFFKEKINLKNIIAYSDVAVSNSFFDNLTNFKVNNFYELDFKKGAVLNAVVYKDQMYAIQEFQTSFIYFLSKEFVNTDKSIITVDTKSDKIISGHKPISSFGTSIRRNVLVNRYGFIFVDENKKEIIKIDTPILEKNNIYYKFLELLNGEEIIDIESYYDNYYKESNFIITTNSNKFTVSYNELLNVFNGIYSYFNDIYIPFKNIVLTPSLGSNFLYSLTSDELKINNEYKDLELEIINSKKPSDIAVFNSVNVITNHKNKIDLFLAETDLVKDRTISKNHHWYKIKEGIHSVPLKNGYSTELTNEDKRDLRGQYLKLKIIIKEILNKINIFAIEVNNRKSNL